MTSDQFFDLEILPASVLVAGDGPIEVELASILSNFGVETTLVAPGRRILPREDRETSQRLAQALREQGLTIITDAVIQSVEKSGSRFKAVMGEKTLEAARILVGSPQVEHRWHWPGAGRHSKQGMMERSG